MLKHKKCMEGKMAETRYCEKCRRYVEIGFIKTGWFGWGRAPVCMQCGSQRLIRNAPGEFR